MVSTINCTLVCANMRYVTFDFMAEENLKKNTRGVNSSACSIDCRRNVTKYANRPQQLINCSATTKSNICLYKTSFCLSKMCIRLYQRPRKITPCISLSSFYILIQKAGHPRYCLLSWTLLPDFFQMETRPEDAGWCFKKDSVAPKGGLRTPKLSRHGERRDISRSS